MISKEEFVKLVTQGDPDALFNGMFGPIQHRSISVIGQHPSLPQTVAVPDVYYRRHSLHASLPANQDDQANLATRLIVIAQELIKSAQLWSWMDQVELVMFSGLDENVYFVVHGQNIITLPLGGNASDREDLASLYEEFILHIQHGYFTCDIGDLRRKLQLDCPTPAGWSFEPGVVTTNLTPDIQVKILAQQGGQLHFDISYKNSCERGYSDIQSIQDRLSGVLGVMLHKRIGKMSKKVLAENLSAIPAWARPRAVEALNNEKKTLEKNLRLAQKRVERAQNAILKLNAIADQIKGTS